MESSIVKIQGDKAGSWVYLYQNHRLYFDAQASKTKNVYRCAHRRKGCKFILYEHLNGSIGDNGEEHLDLEDSTAIETDNYRKAVDETVRAGGSLKDITNTLTERFSHIKSRKTIGMKVRRTVPPVPIPRDLKVLSSLIRKLENDQVILQGEVSTEKGTALIFGIHDMTQRIHSKSKITVDRVTNVLPHREGTEILTINLVQSKGLLITTYALFVVYLSESSQSLFEEILKFVAQKEPSLKSVETVFVGTCQPLTDAVAIILPDAAIQILWSDYVKDIGALWQECGLGDSPKKIYHHLMILGLSGEDRIKAGMEFVDEEIRAHITDFPQLGSFFYLFKTRWDNNLKLLGAPLEALQVHRRTEAVGRYLSVQFGYNKKSVEKLTRVLYETLKSENDLMKSFQSGEKRLIKDKTNSFVLSRDVTHFMTVNQQCTRKRISLASFFATCLTPPLLSKLHGLLRGPENRTSATPLLTSDSNNGEVQAVNSGFFKRKHAAKIVDISALPSMSGSKKQHTGGPRPESPEPLGHASDDEQSLWEFDGYTFTIKQS